VTEAKLRQTTAKPPRGVWMLRRGAKQPFAERRRRAESRMRIHADAANQKTTEPREWGLTIQVNRRAALRFAKLKLRTGASG
jgi:hypothetical protein